MIKASGKSFLLIPPRAKVLKLLSIGAGMIMGVLCVGLLSQFSQILRLDDLVTLQSGWKRLDGKVYTSDTVLGYRPLPGARAEEIYTAAGYTPIFVTKDHSPEMRVDWRQDEDGFRIPAQGFYRRPMRPLILTLGCSYTYGDGCPAEKTFSFRIQSMLHAKTLNGGVCGYGLAQMLLRGVQLIREYKPDIVIAQFSPWLPERSESAFRTSTYSDIPVPYFTFIERKNAVAIVRPEFQSRVFDLPVEHFVEPSHRIFQKIAYIWEIRVPILLHDSILEELTRIAIRTGIKPTPLRDETKLINYSYSELLNACHLAHSKLYVLLLGTGNKKAEVKKVFASLQIPVIDADAALEKHIGRNGDYNFMYSVYWTRTKEGKSFWDSHPNALAHQIIADEIVRVISRDSSQNQGGSFFEKPAKKRI